MAAAYFRPIRYINGVGWRNTGFQIQVDRVPGTKDRFLTVSDLNPEAHIRQRLTRLECASLGLLLLWRSLFASYPS